MMIRVCVGDGFVISVVDSAKEERKIEHFGGSEDICMNTAAAAVVVF